MVQCQGIGRAIGAARIRFRECRAAAQRMAKNRSFEERLAADAEEKRRRLDALPGKPGPCLDGWDWMQQTMVLGACADLAPFGCCWPW
jgi:hypothetical protein